jgi:hypothetical protein
MLLQSLRALYLASGGPGSIWKYFEALVRSTVLSGRFACGFRTHLHFADVGMISRRTSSVPKKDVVSPDCSTVIRGTPRLVAGAPRLVVGAPRCSQVQLKASVSVQSTLGFDHPGILVRQLSHTPRGFE